MVQRGRNAEQPRNCPPPCLRPAQRRVVPGVGNQKAKASGIGICPNVNDSPPSTGSVHVRVYIFELSPSCTQSQPIILRRLRSSVFNYRQTFAYWKWNVSRPDGSTTDRDPLLRGQRFEIESRNLSADIRFIVVREYMYIYLYVENFYYRLAFWLRMI